MAAVSDGAEWKSDYGDALRDARQAERPLLIVLDRPREPVSRVDQVNLVADATQAELLKPYQLCHVDVTTDYGRRIAKAFGASRFPYTAITDKTASVIIFESHDKFDAQSWVTTLASHRRGERPEAEEGPFRRGICFT
jgi:hypothetical protein